MRAHTLTAMDGWNTEWNGMGELGLGSWAPTRSSIEWDEMQKVWVVSFSLALGQGPAPTPLTGTRVASVSIPLVVLLLKPRKKNNRKKNTTTSYLEKRTYGRRAGEGGWGFCPPQEPRLVP